MIDLIPNVLPAELLTPHADETHEFINAEQVQAKLGDAMLPGFEAEFDPAEAEVAGAFVEDALSEADARDSGADLMPPAPPPLAG